MSIYRFKFELLADVPTPPGPEGSSPWWLCAPKPVVTPCPVRMTGFVPLKDYDNDFKFPLTSSRVGAKVVRPEECMVCRPTLVGQPDPVDPVDPPSTCASLEVRPYSPIEIANEDSLQDMPSWFSWGDTSSIAIRFPDADDDGVVHFLTWDGNAYSEINNLQFPFDDYDPILVGEIAEPQDSSPDDFNWSCINVSTYTPA